MKLKRAPRRPQSESIIALIDVVFFLLVFFMLIGRMDATAPFDVQPASAVTGSDMPAGGATLSLSATGDLALDGTLVTPDEAVAQLENAIAANADLLIRVNAHRDARMQMLLPLVARIETLGAREVMLVVTPEAP